MSIVTLTTDLGYRDHYLAIVKAGLISKVNALQIIDLSCEIRNNNISDAAYVLRNALPHFPENSIHLVGIKFVQEKSMLNNQREIDNSRYLITRYKNQFILSPDNGLFSLIDVAFNEKVYQIYYSGEHKRHFFMKDVFVDAAVHLLENKALEDIANPTEDYYRATRFESYLQGNILRGKAIYVDDFGNLITNLKKDVFEKAVGKKNFSITFPGKHINKISQTYDDVKHGALVVFFNSADHLEVAINGGSAYSLLCPKELGMAFDFNLMIEIHD